MAERDGGGPAILVVNANPEARAALRRRLVSTGLEVLGAARADEAVHKLAGARFDLVLLDAHLPDMELEAAIEALRSADPEVRIVSTGGAGEAQRVFGGNLSVLDHLDMDAGTATLLALIGAALATPIAQASVTQIRRSRSADLYTSMFELVESAQRDD